MKEIGTTQLKPKPKKVTIKGAYGTSNKMFFKGRIIHNDSIIDVSAYAENEISDEDLQSMQLNVTFEDLEKARKPKPKK